MSVDEILDKLGSEYKLTMEKDRQKYFLDSLQKLCDIFKCVGIINDMDDKFPMIKFLETLYNVGFYRGLQYGFDSNENMIVDDSDIPLKYSDEISEEINQSILERTGENIEINLS